MTRHRFNHPCRAATGLTLLEVLIALVVLSIGMVGLGALMVTALSNVHSSSQYSLASALALDFEERLWFDLATASATDPDSLSNGCLSFDQITGEDGVAATMVAQWNQADDSWDWTTTGARRFLVPELNVTVDNDDLAVMEVNTFDGESTGLRWQKLESVQISWDEGRFELDGGEESVEIAIGLLCRPIFN